MYNFHVQIQQYIGTKPGCAVGCFYQPLLGRVTSKGNCNDIIKIHEPENYQCVILKNTMGAKDLCHIP